MFQIGANLAAMLAVSRYNDPVPSIRHLCPKPSLFAGVEEHGCMPFACQPRTLRNKDALPTVQTSKQRCLGNRTHPVGTSLTLTTLT